MKKIYLSPLLLVFLLTIFGCQKSDYELKESADGANVLSKAKAVNAGTDGMNAVTVCDNIDFEGVGDFTFLLRDGAQFLTAVKSKNGLGPIKMDSYSPNKPEWGGPMTPAAVIFNSTDPHWEDPDLGTPNGVAVPGGKGKGAGGESGAYINDQYLRNIVVIQEFNPKYYPEPNDGDVDGNFITFDFSNVGPVTASYLTVIDVEAREGESGAVKLYDRPGGTLLYTAVFPNTGQNGVGRISLNTAGVGYMVVEINGSIGIDNLEFCRQVQTGSSCTYTQGYWKNHIEAWPVNALVLGTRATPYSKDDLMTIFKTPVKGNGLIALAHQLIAAKLNFAKGADGTAVNAAIADADKMIGNLVVGVDYLPTSKTSKLTDLLASYNEGIIGPGHCN